MLPAMIRTMVPRRMQYELSLNINMCVVARYGLIDYYLMELSDHKHQLFEIIRGKSKNLKHIMISKITSSVLARSKSAYFEFKFYRCKCDIQKMVTL